MSSNARSIVARDVTGREVVVTVDAERTSIDDARTAIARALGVPNARARCYPIGSSDELRGGAMWGDRDARVYVVGYSRARARVTKRRARGDESIEDTGAEARVRATKTDEIEPTQPVDALWASVTADARRASNGEATGSGADFATPIESLQRLSGKYRALARISLFLHRQNIQPTMRLITRSMASEVAVTTEDARAMEALCPGSVRLIERRRSAEEEAGTDKEIVVDVTAPDETGPSAFTTPAYRMALTNADGASEAIALQGTRRSMRSIGGYVRMAEMTDRFGANFGRVVDKYAAAFERGLRDVIERAPLDATKDTPLRAFVDAVLEMRASEAAERAAAKREGILAPPEAMDRPPAPPRARAKRTKKGNTDGKDGSCCSTEPMNVDEFVGHLRETLASSGQIVHVETMKAKPAVRATLSESVSLSDATIAAFKGGIGLDLKSRLFSHQTSAIESILGETTPRKHVIVSSGTASGKSVCYNVPVVDTLLADPNATALYMFPTKALAQDQLRALRIILANVPKSEETVFGIGIYDGDVRSKEARAEVRSSDRLIITNPDMLHVSILPSHKQWVRFLSGLRYVIIDEAHAYSGVFGSHVALIVRRLRRLCSELYGSSPQFIISSATVANPLDHARDLIGFHGVRPDQDTIETVTNDGAPRGVKTFLLWNPALKPGQSHQTNTERKFRRVTSIERGKAALAKKLRETSTLVDVPAEVEDIIVAADVEGARTSPVVEISQILAECVQHNLRCLAFCKTRKLCELVLVYTREILRSSAPHLADKVASYRGGYEAGERRVIEKELFSGVLLGVATTNALELGIDVGSLDVTLHLGFPGSVASLWQQAGRAGRREGRALSVYVGFDGPLDQHFMRQPRALFDAPHEFSYVWAQNPTIVAQHMLCAAFERPLFANPGVDEVYFGSTAREVASQMVAKGRLTVDPGSFVAWNPAAKIAQPLLACTDKSPALDVSVRTIEEERFDVVDVSTSREKIIASVEASKAFFEVYEGAVYTHQGRTLLCTKLDLERRRAHVRMADVKYFTRVKHETTCSVPGGMRVYGETDTSLPMSQCVKCDEVNISTVFTGFSRVARGSQAKFDHVSFPPRSTEFHTVGAWLRIPDEIVSKASEMVDLRAGVHAASHAVLNALPLRVPCGENDVGCECFSADLHAERGRRYKPLRFLIYDRHLGGVGITRRAAELLPELIGIARDLVRACPCARADGCPSCVQRLSCDAHNAHVNKRAAEFVLDNVIAAFAPEPDEKSTRSDM